MRLRPISPSSATVLRDSGCKFSIIIPMHEEYNNAETSEITGIGLERSNCKGGSLAPSVSKINHMERFRRLHQRRQEARKSNHEQVVEEDRLSKLPKNYEMKQMRQKWELEEMEMRREAEKYGEDYDRLKALNYQADLFKKKEFLKSKKKNPDKGFSDYEAMTLRQYQRLTGNIKPDMYSYEKMRQIIGNADFYPTADTLVSGSHYPTEAAMDKLAESIKDQQKKRDQYHRRRMFDPDAPIDYINERNRKFNLKLDRFYNKYTEDLKSDLERGTAI